MKHRHPGLVQYRTRKGRIRLRQRPAHVHYITLTFSDGRRRRVPFVEPMRPKATDEVWDDPNVIAEEKKDGSATYMYGDRKRVAFANRRGVDKTRIYPELSDKERLNSKGMSIVQGEAYALKGRKDNFDAFLKRDLLQNPVEAKKRMRKYPLKFEAFDILMKNNEWVTDEPLRERKDLLEGVVPNNAKDVKLAKVYAAPAKATKELMKDKTVEGMVYKDLESKYKPGKHNDWRKKKFTKEADVILTGYNPGTGKRKNIGAVNVSVWDKGKVREVATVGAGFTEKGDHGKNINEIKKRLDKGERLFGKVGYLSVGSKGRLRAPVFEGLRTDLSSVKQTHI